MKKILTFLLSIFIILFLGVCDVVSALDITSGSTTSRIVSSSYDRNYNGFFIKDNLNLTQAWTHNFEFNNFTIDKQDYFIFNMFFNYYDTITSNYQDTGSISGNHQTETTNSYYYCNNWTTQYQVYADGTRSSYQVCTNWQLNNNFELIDENTITNGVETTTLNNKVGLQVDLLTDNAYWTVCEIQNDYNGIVRVVCPINSNRTSINRLRIRYTNLKWGEGTTYASIGIANIFNLMRDTNSAIVEEQQETNQKIDDLNNNLTSSDVSNNNTNSTIDNINNMMPTNETISSVVSMPLVLLDSLNTSFSGTCNKLTLINLTLGGKSWKFELPCINMSEIMGSSWAIIDTIMSGVLIFAMGKSMLRTFVKFTSLDSNLVEEAYQ